MGFDIPWSTRKAVVAFSGGLDSTVLLTAMTDRLGPSNVLAVSFNYGQRHIRELAAAKGVCSRLNVRHIIVDLPSLAPLWQDLGSTSSLVDPGTDVPDGHYAQDNMRSTIVPNRNMILIAISTSMAVAWGAQVVAVAVHGGDHFIYPDCRFDFIQSMARSVVLGTRHEDDSSTDPGATVLLAPFIEMTKAEIVRLGYDTEAPMELSWSCYKGGSNHCGKCGTCVERIEAFRLAGVDDPTLYDDIDFADVALSRGG